MDGSSVSVTLRLKTKNDSAQSQGSKIKQISIRYVHNSGAFGVKTNNPKPTDRERTSISCIRYRHRLITPYSVK